ncbi:hypothetical protein [Vibrio agarivorans]|uniref:Uncharacterized protein n=1 Tax=Vibrio agarivorans TaxID=153622 RepID=A0ABT7Y733_9VIBR|nr:hypothetical protein [Vibrio agarivorans]MDN2483866.1 hypothetical protein [Vibrio agarivorans]
MEGNTLTIEAVILFALPLLMSAGGLVQPLFEWFFAIKPIIFFFFACFFLKQRIMALSAIKEQ